MNSRKFKFILWVVVSTLMFRSTSTAQSCAEHFAERTSLAAIKNFSGTRFFVKSKEVGVDHSSFSVGPSYTVLVNQATGELIIGYQTKVPFLLKLYKGFRRTNAGTHLSLLSAVTGNRDAKPNSYQYENGAMRIRPDGVVEVAGYSTYMPNVYNMKTIIQFFKKIDPTMEIIGTPDRLSNINVEGYRTFHIGPDEEGVRNTPGEGWIIF